MHFVGSNTGNPTRLLQRLHDTQHDGWPGWRIDRIAGPRTDCCVCLSMQSDNPAAISAALLKISLHNRYTPPFLTLHTCGLERVSN